MKFPQLSDIANTSVIHIQSDLSISSALDLMVEENHRNIIVIEHNCFKILTVIDILRIKNNNIDLNTELYKLDLDEVPTITKDKNILDTLEYLNNSIEHICVINEDKTLYGLITHTDITSNIDPEILIDNYKLSDFLKLGRRIRWVSKELITSELLKDMIENSFDNVIIVENMVPIGILTTKDILKLLKQKNNLEIEVSHYMTKPVETIHKNASIKDALQFVKQKHYKRVVVVNDEGILDGIITQKELIALTYSRWAMIMKEYQEELSEINNLLEDKNKRYETMASTDSLTGLYNRYKFSELYISAYTTMIQRENEMSIILLDIDFFKQVNDTYGHNAGDQVLIQISHALLKTLRSIDIICRWGGEEFIVLLPTASLENASKLAEKLRLHIENLDIDIVNQVHASFGVSQVREGEEMSDAIDRADKSLYLAKHSGRNCVKTEKDLK